MPTLQHTAASPAPASAASRPECPINGGMRRLAPSLMRAAVDTAGAFLCVPASLGSAWEAPRTAIPEALHCSQMNIGEKYQLLCNLSVDKADWYKLFTAGVGEQIRMDAYCEMANCICGAVLADAAFTDEFGYLIPCVPCNGASRPDGEARTERGSMLVGGAWIRFSFTVQECAAA
jgi:hypothetical protein